MIKNLPVKTKIVIQIRGFIANFSDISGMTGIRIAIVSIRLVTSKNLTMNKPMVTVNTNIQGLLAIGVRIDVSMAASQGVMPVSANVAPNPIITPTNIGKSQLMPLLISSASITPIAVRANKPPKQIAESGIPWSCPVAKRIKQRESIMPVIISCFVTGPSFAYSLVNTALSRGGTLCGLKTT